MNIVFIGASQFGLKCLQTAKEIAGCAISGAVTAPRSFPISYRPEGVVNVLHADVQGYCEAASIPCETINQGMKDEALFAKVRSWKPDMFLVSGWYHLVPKAWRDLAPAYGLHASLLPDYSGGAPLVWAIINGEKRTGITFFQFDGGVDSGPIVAQTGTDILEDDTIATLYARIEDLGLGLLKEHLPRLAQGLAELIPQDESKRRIFPQRGPEDGLIDWNRSAEEIHNFIRAQTRPYPGAFTFWRGQKLSIWRGRMVGVSTLSNRNCGVVWTDADVVFVQTGFGVLSVEDVSLGQENLEGRALAKRLSVGGIFENQNQPSGRI